MKRLRHLLTAAILLLGLVYFFTQRNHSPLSAEPGRTPADTPSNTQLTSELPKEVPSHESDRFPLEPIFEGIPTSEEIPPTIQIPAPDDAPSRQTSVDTLPPPSASHTFASQVEYSFQQDLELDLPIHTLNSLSKYAPHNYSPNGEKSYTYATFMASRNPSVKDPYFLAIQSLIYRVLWSPRSKTEKHPIVVFVGDYVSNEQRQLLAGAGAVVRELSALPWNPTGPGVPSRWKDLFAKLNMWNETEFSRIIFLDADAFPIAKIDDMFEKKKIRKCIKTKMQIDDFLPDSVPVCEEYIFAGVPHDPYSIFDAEINVGSMVFTPNAMQHKRLLQNYLKFDKYDVKMAEQAFLNWQFGINSAYPPGMLDREYGAFFPKEDGREKGLKVVHEKIWTIQKGWMRDEWEGTWREMEGFYGSEEFKELRRKDGEVGGFRY